MSKSTRMRGRGTRLFVVAAVAAVAAVGPAAPAQQLASASSPDGAAEAARDAYVYGYPLVTMLVSRQVLTNVAAPQPNGHAPVNQVGNLLTPPTAAFRDVVAPNVNTLYSMTFLDLSQEPMVVRMPDTHGRYYVMQALDAWTNVFASPGSRTTGTGAQTFAFMGPEWHGTMPRGITMSFRSPTNTLWIINRIQANGPAEYPAVNALQRQISVTPLGMMGRRYMPPRGTVDPSVDMKTPPRQQVNAMNADEFFTLLARGMAENPPAAADSAIVARMRTIGIIPGKTFKDTKVPGIAVEVDSGARMGLAAIREHARTMGTVRNGWRIIDVCGRFGTNYLARASVALIGLGCNLPEDAVYPVTAVDAAGERLMGSRRYTLHFAANELPPVNAFWSVTMYDSSFYLVPNSIDRYARSSYDSLQRNADGSIDLHIQRESPGSAQEANWLPAPAGPFVLALRLYWPKPEVLSGAWVPPGVTPVP